MPSMREDQAVFELGLAKFREQVLEDAYEFQARKVSELYALVTVGTPVDTGKARRGWDLDLAGDGRTPEFEGAEGRLDEGGIAIRSQVILNRLQKFKRFVGIEVVNDVPYIVFLEEGSSSQAPNGMVAVSIAQLEAS